MPFFSPDQCAPHDPAGWGRWLMGHSLEHTQMIPLAAALATPVVVPNFDILAYSDDPLRSVFWRNNHQIIHLALRAASGVTGIDLSLVDFSNDNDFLLWQSDHSTEHQNLRAFFGIS